MNSNILFLDPCVPPVSLLPWLSSQTSINEKLRQLNGDVKTDVLRTQWIRASWWARYSLNFAAEPLYLREVVISSREKPCWYARSYFPEHTYQTHPHFFQALSQRTLGQLIFDPEFVQCIQRDYYAIDERCIEFYWPKGVEITHSGRWIRRAHYRFVDGGDFYLIELFFDDFVDGLL